MANSEDFYDDEYVTTVESPSQQAKSEEEEKIRHIFDASQLDDIWTPAYYGDEANVTLTNEDVDEKWVLFSSSVDGHVVLRRASGGATYDLTDHYKVSIGGDVFRGETLSQLIKAVCEACGGDGARRRNKHCLVYYGDLRHLAWSKEIKPLPYDRNATIIEEGKFSQTVATTCDGNVESGRRGEQVAVKRIKQTSKYALEGAMEVAVMYSLSRLPTIDRQHLLSLIGWYVEADHLHIVTEHMSGGTLLQHLRSLGLSGTEGKTARVRIRLHRFVCEIASGMRVLAANRIQHCNLGARNILLTGDLQIKIADFSLSRPDRSNFTYGRVAMRWAAPEVLVNEADSNLLSDVWSFGVVIWEVYSLGQLPYSDVSNSEMLSYLRKGGRLQVPVGTPSRTADLMAKCWQMTASARPTFEEIDKYFNVH